MSQDWITFKNGIKWILTEKYYDDVGPFIGVSGTNDMYIGVSMDKTIGQALQDALPDYTQGNVNELMEATARAVVTHFIELLEASGHKIVPRAITQAMLDVWGDWPRMYDVAPALDLDKLLEQK